ncbi:MAG TPA: alanine--tRNA ligase [Thermoplasmata archaeon]|nr:alanine--tRNA ligase [Thermoplasmata archaeon]
MPESEYEVELFRAQGFTRQTCAKCGKAFWSLGAHETCGEAPCQEYDFIGASPFKKRLTYRAMREDFLSFLEQNGHARVKRYPIVARWRDDVFFTQASVYPFQPWVISGAASPPANPLAISQPCVRFNDVDNVGKTGQHFTMFEMMAHHAFNFPGKFIYFKDRTVELCHTFLTERLGVDSALVRYKESLWQGGGNSGPCFEVVFGGAEPATLVFMMNRDVNGHTVPMDTQVVDTGYGLERLTWISQGTTSAYEAVFGDALAYLKRATGAKNVDDRILMEYSKVAGMLKVENLADIREIRRMTADRVGITVEELVAQVSPLESLYTVCDHARALIFLLGDGVVPSNSREGYFARLLTRRGLRALKDLNISYTLADTISFMIDQMREDYPEFFFNKGDILKLLRFEEERYKETLLKGRTIVGKLASDLRAAGKGFELDTLLQLYDSHGLNPDVVREFTDLPVEIPDDFYARVAARHEQPTREPEKRIQISKELPATRLRVYEDRKKRAFRAKVLAVEGEAILLDQTYFYPEGGGQEPDHGTIGGYEVYDVQKVGGTVLHFVRGDAARVLGKRVKCEIDALRRDALTRNHSATHIVLGAARKVLGNHVWQAGAHKGQEMARLDITHYDALGEEEIDRIEEAANGRVLRNGLVRQKFIPRDIAERKFGFRLYQGGSVPGGELRVVEFPDWDVEACGGTHVSNASDVGLIKILRSTRIQDGVVRLEYAAGKAALDAIRVQSRQLARTAEALGVPEAQTAEAAARLAEEARAMRRELERIRTEQKRTEAKDLLENPTARVGGYTIVRHQISGPMSDLMKLSRELCANTKATAILGADSPDGAYLIVSRGADVPLDVREAFDLAIARIGGKGGGKPDFAQGKGPARDALSAALDEAERLVRERLGGKSG